MEVKEIEIKFILTIQENIRRERLNSNVADLMSSIKNYGLMQPIGVREIDGEYALIWGHRRLQAFRKLDRKTIPAVIFSEKDDELTEEDYLILNATENVQREQVNVMEFGRICYLLKKRMSLDEIASKMSVPKKRVQQSIQAFLKVPAEMRKHIVLFGTDSRNKKGHLAVTVANNIVNSRDIKAADVPEVLEWARKEEKNIEEVKILGTLLRQGMPMKKAMKEVDKWKRVTIHLAVDRQRFKDEFRHSKGAHLMSFTDWVRDLINKETKGFVF